jgi:type I restriction enzyme, S subunit
MPRLSDIADIMGGFPFKSADLGQTGIPVVKIADINPPIVNTASSQRVPASKTRGLDRFKLHERDIVMAMTGATTGKVGRYMERESAYLNQRVAKISAKRGRDFDDYVYAVLTQPGFADIVVNNASGSAQPNVSAEGIGRIEVPPLPISAQLAVGRITAAIDDKIDLNRKMSATLGAMGRALFKSWFVDFDPVRAKAEGRDPGLPLEIAGLFTASFQDSDLGEIPTGWRALRLGDILRELVSGARPKGGAVLDGVPSVGAENVIGLGRYDFSKEKFIPRDFFEWLQRRRASIRDGDVLLYKDGAHIGRKTYFDRGFPHVECAVNEHVFILRAKETWLQRFMFFWLDQDWMTAEIRALNSNSAQPGINQVGVRSLRILLPERAIVRAFDQKVAPLTDRIFQSLLESRTLAALRDALLPKLVSGELRIRRT